MSNEILDELMKIHGPLITGAELVKVLGYKNSASLRQAKVRGQVPVKLFKIANRKGLYAFTNDIANWLINLKDKRD